MPAAPSLKVPPFSSVNLDDNLMASSTQALLPRACCSSAWSCRAETKWLASLTSPVSLIPDGARDVRLPGLGQPYHLRSAPHPQVFEVGQCVQMRDGDENWQWGTVTSVQPLKVNQDPDGSGFTWDEVRSEAQVSMLT